MRSLLLRHLAVLFIIFTSASNAQTFQWARTIKSQGFDESFDLATDNQGNVYVAGMIEFDADFGEGVILESAGIHDIFVAKYDSTGHLIWARRAGGTDGDKAQSIALDGQGYLYLVGEFELTSYWDTIVKVAQGVNNTFVARYDTSGNVQWVRSFGTVFPHHTRGYAVACDAQSNVYVGGATVGDTYYDSTYLFTTAGDYDGLLGSFDKYGNFRWARRMGGTDSDKIRGIVSDQQSHIYVTGYFSNTADFPGGTTLTTRGHTDVFLAKFDTSGTMDWVKQAGDTGFDRAWDVDINVNGQVLVGGDESRGLFDSHAASCEGMTDAFIAAYDTAGNNLWVTAGGGPEDDEGRGITHDNAGNVYLIGDYGGSAIFPPYSFTGNLFAEPFIVSYTSDGSVLRWVRNGSGPSNDRGVGVGLDPGGNIFATGIFEDSLSLGGFMLHGDSLDDIYITRLSPQNLCSSSASISGSIVCAGTCSGTATVTAIGQTPFLYSWNSTPVQQTQTATGLCAGNYTVLVTDAVGCTSSATITLINPPPLAVNSSSTQLSCFGDCNGTATAIPTGQSPFTYNWNTTPVQNTPVATGLCAGNYTVMVTDSSGCTATDTVSIVNPAQLIVIPTIANVACHGDCNGSADAVTTGQGPFTYSWNTVPVQTTETATGLCADNFGVIVTDAAGCTTTAQAIITEPFAISISGNITDATCNGCSDGAIDITGAGGTGAFQYSWSNGETTEDIQNLSAGNYTVCITDANMCTQCSTFTVNDPATGIKSPDEIMFSVTPNPFTSTATIQLSGNYEGKNMIRLYNDIGELIYVNEFSGTKFIFEAGELLRGIYFIEIQNRNDIKILPVIYQ